MAHLDEVIGCKLGIAGGRMYIQDIRCGGAAALSSRLAVGDRVKEIDGVSVEELRSSDPAPCSACLSWSAEEHGCCSAPCSCTCSACTSGACQSCTCLNVRSSGEGGGQETSEGHDDQNPPSLPSSSIQSPSRSFSFLSSPFSPSSASTPSSMLSSAASMLQGERGAPVWLKCHTLDDEELVVCLIRHGGLQQTTTGEEECGIGIKIVKEELDGGRTGMLVTEMYPGHAAWLARLSVEEQQAPILVNDVIVEVEGSSISGMRAKEVRALIQGPAYTRVKLTIVRGGERRQRWIVRSPKVKEGMLEKVESYRRKVCRFPPTPILDRTNRYDLYCKWKAPSVHGMSVKDAAAALLERSMRADDATGEQEEDERTRRRRIGITDMLLDLSGEIRWNAVALVSCICSRPIYLCSNLRLLAWKPKFRAFTESFRTIDDRRGGEGGGGSAGGGWGWGGWGVGAESRRNEEEGSEAVVSSPNKGFSLFSPKSWMAPFKLDPFSSSSAAAASPSAASSSLVKAGELHGIDWYTTFSIELGKFMEVEESRLEKLHHILRCPNVSPGLYASYLLEKAKERRLSLSPSKQEGSQTEEGRRTEGGDTARAPLSYRRMDWTEREDEGETLSSGINFSDCVSVQEEQEGAGGSSQSSLPQEPGEEEEDAAAAGPHISGMPWTICWLTLAVSVVAKKYDARARGLVRRMARELGVPWRWMSAAEVALCKEIIKMGARRTAGEAEASKSSAWSRERIMRYGFIGGAAAVGGAILAVTGGMAAPAVVAGLTVVGSAIAAAPIVGAGAASFAAAVAAYGGLSMALGVSFGAAGAGLVGYKMARRTGDLQEFEFDLIDCSPGLPVILGIPGWLNDEEDSAWRVWDQALSREESDGGEALALRWESKELRKLGSAISKFLESQAKSYAAGLVGNAVIGAAFATIALPAQLMSFADYIDNAWTVAEQRADQAGEQLARALALRLHGHRPVTLVGYGMGARVVLKALLALSELDNDAGLGIVETAICLGTPDSADSQLWARAASVCGHRLVNGYHEKDWVLGFVYRATTTTLSIAGLQRVAAGHGSGYLLENVDLTDTLRGHWDYREKLKELVEMTGVTSGFTDYSKKPVIESLFDMEQLKAIPLPSVRVADATSAVSFLRRSNSTQDMERAEKESPNGKKSKPLCMDIFLDEDEFLERPHSR